MIARTLTPFLSFIIAILLVVFFIKPQYAEIKVRQGELAAYKDIGTNYRVFDAKLNEKISKKNERSISELERLNQMVPNEVDSAEMLIILEKIAQESNLLFGDISIIEKEKVEPQQTYTQDGVPIPSEPDHTQWTDINFNLIGDYEGFKAFLKRVEQSSPFFEIIKIDIVPEEKLIFQRFDLTVRTYSFSE